MLIMIHNNIIPKCLVLPLGDEILVDFKLLFLEV